MVMAQQGQGEPKLSIHLMARCFRYLYVLGLKDKLLKGKGEKLNTYKAEPFTANSANTGQFLSISGNIKTRLLSGQI